MTPWRTTLETARNGWRQRPQRERRLIALGAVVLAAAMLWVGLLMPAWRTWSQAPEQQARLETQTRQMLRLQSEVQQLQGPQRIDRVQALQRLNSSAQALLGSSAQLSAQGEELRVTLQRASASALAEWLVQARDQAQSLPRMAQLHKHEPDSEATQRQPAAADPPASVTWSGTLVLRLP